MKSETVRRRMTVLAALFLVLCFLASCYLSWRTSEHIYDADASSELILAQLLNEEGGILSENWYYSTELRVLNTQLVYAPLFSVFSSWRMVRFAGSVILQAILVLSFLFSARQAGVRLSVRLFTAGLLLLPVSVTHAQMLLMHCYYVPHAAIGFFLIGLLIAGTDLSRKLWQRLLYFIAFVLLGFLSGLGGVRQLMVTFLPLLLTGFVLLFTDRDAGDRIARFDRGDRFTARDARLLLNSQAVRSFLALLIGSFSAFVGYVVNSRILAAKYSFFSFEHMALADLSAEQMGLVLTKLFGVFGYRGGRSALVMSVTGVFALLGVGCCLAAIALAIRMLQKKTKPASYAESLVGGVFLAGVIVTFLLYVFTLREARVSYFLPIYVLAIGTLAIALESALSHPRRLVRIVIGCMTVAMLGNAALTVRYFVAYHCGETVQTQSAINYADYEGHIDDVRELRGAVDYLTENGYEIGYASFWNGNICTEMTEGKLRFVNLHIDAKRGFLYYHWLMRKNNVADALAAERPFLLVERGEYERILASDALIVDDTMPIVYEDENYLIYGVK